MGHNIFQTVHILQNSFDLHSISIFDFCSMESHLAYKPVLSFSLVCCCSHQSRSSLHCRSTHYIRNTDTLFRVQGILVRVSAFCGTWAAEFLLFFLKASFFYITVVTSYSFVRLFLRISLPNFIFNKFSIKALLYYCKRLFY